MQPSKISCKASIDGKLLPSPATCGVNPKAGQLNVGFERSVELIGTHRREFSRPRFWLYPFTPSLLTRWSDELLAQGTTLEMSGTDIGCWQVEHDPRERRYDSYRLKAAIVKTKFFCDGISLEIEASTELGISEYEGRILARDLPAVDISISIFVPTTELGRFLMPEESQLLYFIEEKLSKLPESAT